MPRIGIRLSESAMADLAGIRARYTGPGVPDIGERLLVEILERVEGLRTHPEKSRIVPEFDQSVLRELIHPPFRIVCRLAKSRLQVVRVWRSERRLRSRDVAD
jgi:plasmid stabilization system protein ParE